MGNAEELTTYQRLPMTARPDCHHELLPTKENYYECLYEFMDQEIGHYLQELIATTIPQDQINSIQLRSSLSHLSQSKVIEVLASEEVDMKSEVKLYRDIWKDINKEFEDFRNFLNSNDAIVVFSYLSISTINIMNNCISDIHKKYNIDIKDKKSLHKAKNLSDRDGTILEWLIAMYALYKQMYLAGLISLCDSLTNVTGIEQPDDNIIYYQAIIDMLEVWNLKPIYLSIGIKSTHSSANRIAIDSLAGWVSTKLNTRFFKTYDEGSLTHESISDNFLDNLINSTFISWHDLKLNNHLSDIQIELKRLVSKAMSMDGPQRPSESTRLTTEPWQHRLIGYDFGPNDLEEWQARQRAAQEIGALSREAGLGDREAMVLELLRQGLTDEKIAERMEITPTTVRVTKFHTMRKLRRASNQ